MNKNDRKTSSRYAPSQKGKRPVSKNKGKVDPSQIVEYKVYVQTTLMDFLIYKMGEKSRKTVKSLLSHHQVSVGGVPTSQFDYALFPEDTVIVSKRRMAKHERKDLPILYEDQDLIVIDKPSGLLSVASDREKGRTAYRLVSDYVAQKDKKARLFIVHRLDEDTSGVLVFAKSNEVKDALQKKWQDIVAKRYYYAIVEGQMEEASATYRDYLEVDENTTLVHITKNHAAGKLSTTAYKLIKAKGPFSLLDVHISSGRKNQIRVQLGSRGHYVIGDDKYGDPANPLGRLGLHAYELAFTNPLNGKSYDFVSPMPKEFKAMFFDGHYDDAALTKEAKAKEAKRSRATRSQTKIDVGKRKSAAKAHRFGVKSSPKGKR